MYTPRKNESFYIALNYLNFFHYYPIRDKSKDYFKMHRLFLRIFLRFFTSFSLISSILHMVISLRNGNSYLGLTKDFSAITLNAQCMYICLSFEFFKKEFSALFNEIQNITLFGAPPNISKSIKTCNFWTLLFIIYGNIGVFGTLLNEAFLQSALCRKKLEGKNSHEYCGVLNPIWWPEIHANPNILLFLRILQALSIFGYIVPAGVMFCLIWEESYLIISKINDLKIKFSNAFNAETAKERRELLEFCIRYHQNILEILQKYNTLWKKVAGQTGFVAAFPITFLLADILKTRYVDSVSTLMSLIGFTALVFLLCHSSQIIYDETLSIQEALYNSKWYEYLEESKDLLIIFMRFRKPGIIQAFLLGNYNYILFLGILKSCYSYISLLINTSN